MSRSVKRNPVTGNAAGSDKSGKREANRALRRHVKVAITEGREVLPELREVSDVWTMPKDGKHWWAGLVGTKWMRK